MQETQVRSLGQENPLEEDMATHFSILDWRIPWTEEPGRLQTLGSQRVEPELATKQQWPINNVVIVSGAWQGTQPYIYMYRFSSELPSLPGYHITLSRVSCFIQYVLVGYLF